MKLGLRIWGVGLKICLDGQPARNKTLTLVANVVVLVAKLYLFFLSILYST